MDIFDKCTNFQEAKALKALELYPFFKVVESSEGSSVVANGRKVVMTGSNNYLGLTHDPRVKQAAIDAINKYGTGCTGSRFLNGNLDLHERLEERLAAFVGKEAALVFSTGFLTNLGAVSCLAEDSDIIFSDAENHASIIEGCRSAKGKVVKYRHNSAEDLRAKLTDAPSDKGKIILSDGVFSMTGEMVQLDKLVGVKRDFPGTRIYLDDAHGLGVMGKKGRGTADRFNLTEEVDLIMGTFSKSFASIGGFVAGDFDVVDYIRHKSRALIFSAAMPPSAVATVLKVLEIIETEEKHLANLWRNLEKMRKGFAEIGVCTIRSDAPIISIFIGDEGKAFQLVKALFEKGVFATPVIYPAVGYGQALIRTSYMATHTEGELDHVLNAFDDLSHEYGITAADVDPRQLEQFSRSHYNFGI